jgi:nucleosome binding factor SPN SPT16 subunit
MDAAADPSKEPVAVKLKPENVEICYPFIVQSGGEYDLRWTAGSNDRNLVYEPTGVVICQLGCRYKWYCSNVGRTYLIDPPRVVSDAYSALLAAHAAACAALREGARCSDVHAAAVAALTAAPGGAELVPHLTKTLGTATGLEFRENTLSLGPKCDATIPAGTAFNVTTGLADMVNPAVAEGARGRQFALLLADTVIVLPGGAAPEICTIAKSALSDISYEINEQVRYCPQTCCLGRRFSVGKLRASQVARAAHLLLHGHRSGAARARGQRLTLTRPMSLLYLGARGGGARRHSFAQDWHSAGLEDARWCGQC